MRTAMLWATFGLAIATPVTAQLPALQDRPLSAAERLRMTSLESQFARISAQRSTSFAALRTIARALGSRLTALDPAQVLKIVDDRAQELVTARSRIQAMQSQLESLDSMKLAQAVSPLLTAAKAAIDDGRLDDADTSLAQVAARFGEARTNLQARAESFGAQEADVLAQQAGVRASLSDFTSAAELWGKASDLSTTGRPQIAWRYSIEQANALTNAGFERKLDGAARSLEVLKQKALPLAPRAERPADWATTQFMIGVNEIILSYASTDNAHNEAAVTALRLSVAETGPATAPDIRILRQIKLATALSALSFRTETTTGSDEAIAIVQAIEAGQHPETFDFYFSLGNINGERATLFQAKGQSAEAIAALQASVLAFEKAATKIDKAAERKQYLAICQNLAFAYTLLADYRRSPGDAAHAIDSSAKGLAITDRERNPRLWAGLKLRHGQALIQASEYAPAIDEAQIDAGITDLNEAAGVATKEVSPTEYADIHAFLGKALALKARAHPSAGAFAAAIAAYRESAIFNTLQASPSGFADIRIEIAKLLAERAVLLSGDERARSFDEATRLLAEVATTVAASRDPRLKVKFASTRAALDQARDAARR